MRNWQSVLMWWWRRGPKSIGWTIVALLVAGGLFLAERGGLTGGSSSSRDVGVADVEVADVDSSGPATAGSSRAASIDQLVTATQATAEADAPPQRPRSQPKDEPTAQPKTDPSADRKEQPQAKAKAQEPLGKLTLVEGKTYRSTAGLVYTPGSAEGHRLKHVAAHFKDNPSKPVHGVFSGTERENFAAIDEAYLIALTEPKRAKIRRERDRTTYEVDLKRKIGYVGGRKGQRSSRPLICTGVKLVLEGDRVITAFPMSFR